MTVTLNIYLAGAFSRRSEIDKRANELAAHGISVVSRWHGWKSSEPYDGPEAEMPNWLARMAAEQDIDDLGNAGALILFLDDETEYTGNQGRMIETGIAIAMDIPVHVVGEWGSIFARLLNVATFATWEECRDHLTILVGDFNGRAA